MLVSHNVLFVAWLLGIRFLHIYRRPLICMLVACIYRGKYQESIHRSTGPQIFDLSLPNRGSGVCLNLQIYRSETVMATVFYPELTDYL